MSELTIINDGKRNPVIQVPRDMVIAWLRQIADEAGFADRPTAAVQIVIPDCPNVGETFLWLDAPTLNLMVSNIPNSATPPHPETEQQG